jgi:hypothetical protein
VREEDHSASTSEPATCFPTVCIGLFMGPQPD